MIRVFRGVKAICLAKQTEEIGAGIFYITILTFSYFKDSSDKYSDLSRKLGISDRIG